MMIKRDDSATVAITLKASCNPVNLTMPLYVFIDKKTRTLIRKLETRRPKAPSQWMAVKSRLLLSIRAVNKAMIPAPKSRMKMTHRGTILILFMSLIV